MKLSVIIPTYNNVKTLKESLKRVFNQDFPKDQYEVIVVNDGSLDDTSQYLAQLKPLVKFKFINNSQNLGRAKTRNLGIKAAFGEIIVLIDDDIWVENDFLKKHQEAHSSLDKNVIVVGGSQSASAVLKTIWNNYLSSRYTKTLQIMRQRREELPYYLFRTGNVSLKRSVFDDIGLFDEGFSVYGGEDTDFGFRLSKCGYKLVYREIIGQHYFSSNLQSILAKALERGESTHFLVRKYPELWQDMQFHSVFYQDSPWWKNILKFSFYNNISICLNTFLVNTLTKLGFEVKPLLGFLEWQYYVKGIKSNGKSLRA